MPRKKKCDEPENPFRVGGVVTKPYFTDRAGECARVRKALTEPQAHLLVYGPRRMGKTSVLKVVQEGLEKKGVPVLFADLSTATALTDVTTRLLQSATRVLGRKWRDAATSLFERLHVGLRLEHDPATGIVLPSVDVALRDADLDTQRRSLTSALEAIESLATDKRTRVGLILDEFQELHRFGAADAEWHLRGIIQQHTHVSYVLAGSDESLIASMLGEGRAFYGLLDTLFVGPIGADHLARWIEQRCADAGVNAEGLGPEIVGLAGPRTRDVVQLARVVFDLARPAGVADVALVEEAFSQIIQAGDALHRALWESLSPLQQNVLRAFAVQATGLTTKATSNRFSLGAPGAASKAAHTLVGRDVLVKRGAGYEFDNPYHRGWVLLNALPDLGINLPATHMPVRSD